MIGKRLSRYVFWKYYRPRLTEIIAPSFPIIIDYPVKCSPRYGYGKPPHRQLTTILEAGREEYAKRLSAFCSLKEELSQIPGEGSPESVDPCWGPDVFHQPRRGRALRHAVGISSQETRRDRLRIFD